MSKNLKISTGVHPFKGDNLLFVNLAGNEQAVGLAKAFAPKGVEAFVLAGCEITQGGGSISVSAGWVYWDVPSDKAYLLRVPAKTVTTTGLVNVRLRLDLSQDVTGYPTSKTYFDGSSHQVYTEDLLTLQLTTDIGGGDKVLSLTAVGGVTQVMYAAYEIACEGDFKDWTVPTGKALSDYFDGDGIGFGKQAGWCIARGQAIGGVTMPDERGRVSIAAGQLQLVGGGTGATYADKDKVGVEGVTLTGSQVGVHNHPIFQLIKRAVGWGGRTVSINSGDANLYDIDETGGTGATATASAHENRQPSSAKYRLYRYM